MICFWVFSYLGYFGKIEEFLLFFLQFKLQVRFLEIYKIFRVGFLLYQIFLQLVNIFINKIILLFIIRKEMRDMWFYYVILMWRKGKLGDLMKNLNIKNQRKSFLFLEKLFVILLYLEEMVFRFQWGMLFFIFILKLDCFRIGFILEVTFLGRLW